MAHNANKPSLDIFVEGGAKTGLGHLRRSARLRDQLVDLGCAVNFFPRLTGKTAKSLSEELGISPPEPPSTPSKVVVIDAVSLCREQLEQVFLYEKRIVISHTFDRPELATHLMLRSPLKIEGGYSSLSASVVIDSRFAFAGIEEPRREVLDFSSIRVGIYAGAQEQQKYWNVIGTLLASDKVTSIVALGMESLAQECFRHQKLTQKSFAPKPWDFLKGINVFVGSTGVMLAESIARGLPTFSVSDQKGLEKNHSLINEGLLRAVSLEGPIDDLSDMITSVPLLGELHERCAGLNITSMSFALALAIQRLVH